MEETRACQNCKENFRIEPEDFEFYAKMEVPPPTWCPQCRFQRRLTFKNERSLHKGKCDLCGQAVISQFPKNVPFPTYCPPCFFSDKWDAMDYGIDYDPDINFFAQFRKLMERVPRLTLNIDYPRTIGGTYMNLTGPVKNCYMIFLAENCEETMYSSSVFACKNCVDCMKTDNSTDCYELFNSTECYNCTYSSDLKSCIDVQFSDHLTNCTSCFGCTNLNGKSYHIFNEPYSKEGYSERLKELRANEYMNVDAIRSEQRRRELSFPVKFMHGTKNENVSGDYIYHSKNVTASYEVIGGEDCKYCQIVNMPTADHCYDYGDWGNRVSYMYESVNCGEEMTNVKFSYGTWIGNDQEYCDVLMDCDHVFGCISMFHKKYCILNKQYSPEDFAALRQRIRNDMLARPYVDKKGNCYAYGEFFPAELSPHSYNATVAAEYFPLSEKDAREAGYGWNPPEANANAPTLRTEELPETISETSEDILNATIPCIHHNDPKFRDACTKVFRITPQELSFYRLHDIPIPRACYRCRYAKRFKLKNPPQLWRRRCQCAGQQSKNGLYSNTTIHYHGDDACENQFDTSYAPDRQEIVYCEKCYQYEIL